jgi:hypothetical protein
MNEFIAGCRAYKSRESALKTRTPAIKTHSIDFKTFTRPNKAGMGSPTTFNSITKKFNMAFIAHSQRNIVRADDISLCRWRTSSI